MKNGSSQPGLAVCLEYPLDDHGGVCVIASTLIAALASEYRIWLVSPDVPERLAANPLSSRLAGHIPFLMAAHPPAKRFFTQAHELAGRLQAEEIHIVHIHCGGVFGWGNRWPGPSIPEILSARGMKTVWTSHSTELPDRAFAARRRAPWISKALSPVGRAGKGRQARKVETEIVVSEHNLRFVEDHYPGARGHLRRIYHSRLGDESLRPPVPREPVFLSVGHLSYRKGQHVLASAFLKIAEELPQWKLVIVGGDSGGDGCGKDIRAAMQAHAHGSRVILAGAHDRPVEWMERAGIFLQPSLEEALGLALQEAIFTGCPAIGSRAGGIPEVIDEGENGLLVPPGDVDALAEAMLRLARDESLREQMSKAGRESIIRKGMNRGAMIEAHRQLYHTLLA